MVGKVYTASSTRWIDDRILWADTIDARVVRLLDIDEVVLCIDVHTGSFFKVLSQRGEVGWMRIQSLTPL